jgi:uncharacterized membrane protein YbhN (UPF0104 family)
MKTPVSGAIKAIVTVVLLVLVFRAVPVARVFEAIRRASLSLFAAGFVAGLFALWASALRLKRLTGLQRMPISVRGHLAIHLSSAFYGLFLPGVLAGSVLRWHRMYAPGRNAAGALVVVLLNRLIATTATAAVGVLLWALTGWGRGQVAAGAIMLAVLAGLLVLQAGLLLPGVAGWWVRFLDARWVPEVVRGGFRHVALAIGHYRGLSARTGLEIVALAFAEEALGILAFVLFARSVGLAVAPVDLGWVRALVTLATTVPVSVAGLGVREGSLVLLLAPYGIAGAEAVALSTLVFVRALLLGLAGALVEARRWIAGRGGPSHATCGPAGGKP